MARAQFIADEAFELTLGNLKAKTRQVAEAALYAGAAVIADQMKANLEGILSPQATGQLVAAFGVTPAKLDKWFIWNVHIGFDGYHIPGQVPFQLIARSFESGAVMGSRYTGKVEENKWETKDPKFGPEDYWRYPTPFAKPAVLATKQQTREAMARAAEREIEKIAQKG